MEYRRDEYIDAKEELSCKESSATDPFHPDPLITDMCPPIPTNIDLISTFRCSNTSLNSSATTKRPIYKVYIVDTTRISTSSLSTLQRASYLQFRTTYFF